MHPKLSVWSDYGAPSRRQWMSPSRRGPGASIGPKILLAAVVVVTGVIGISGIYPQIIDMERVPDAGSPLPVMSSIPMREREGSALSPLLRRRPMSGIPRCCARPLAGHTAAPAKPAMNSRRRIFGPSR